jgi:hypothetical protein
MLVERGDNARAVSLLKDAAANSTGQRDEARKILEDLTANNATFENVADARKLLDDLKRN